MADAYKSAAQILTKVLNKTGSVKSLIITSHFPNKRKLYALVCETLKFRTVIEEILEKTQFEKHERKPTAKGFIACKFHEIYTKSSQNFSKQKASGFEPLEVRHTCALVLVYDFLFGAGLQCGGALKESVMRNKSSLQSALARLKVKAGVSRNEDLLPKEVREPDRIPRYVRVNTIKTTVPQVVQHFVENGFSIETSDDPNWSKVSGPVPQILRRDDHLQDVLVFPSATDLHDHALYTAGHILLQDKVEVHTWGFTPTNHKAFVQRSPWAIEPGAHPGASISTISASCLPAHVLNPPAGSHVIDACAAPGNKTSHMASLMCNKGVIFAFDVNGRRLKILEKMMTTAGVKCVTTKNCSFLNVNPSDLRYSNVQYILVDPSCSGSGIVSRMDCLVDNGTDLEEQQKRLTSLAKFQLSALQHALSFPAVQRVVYSTCSIHQEENEDVVQKALEANFDRFELGCALPLWPHRGDAVFPEAVKCVRASPDQDATNGFFVALFARKHGTTQGQTHGQTQVQTPAQTQDERHGQTQEETQGQTEGYTRPSAAPTSEDGCTSSVDTSSAKRRKRKRKKESTRSTAPEDLSTAPLAVVPPFVNLSKRSKRKKKRKSSGKKTKL